MTVEYRETIDYVYSINRQVDRVMEAYSRIDPRDPAAGLRRVYVALRGLIVMASPFIDWKTVLAELRASLGSSKDAWDKVDNIMSRVLVELDRVGLLTRKTKLLVGEYSADTE